MLCIGRRNSVVGLLETPNSSKLKNMPSWKALSSHPDVFSTRCDSCRYGSIHLKSFKFLSVGMRLRFASLRCNRSGPHVPVQGALTKLSATYTDQLSEALAKDFALLFSCCSLRIPNHVMLILRVLKTSLSMRLPFRALGRFTLLGLSEGLPTLTCWN